MKPFNELKLSAGCSEPSLDANRSLSGAEVDKFNHLDKKDKFKLMMKWPLPEVPEYDKSLKPKTNTSGAFKEIEKLFTIDDLEFKIKYQTYQASLKFTILLNNQMSADKFIKSFVDPFLKHEFPTEVEDHFHSNCQRYREGIVSTETGIESLLQKCCFDPIEEEVKSSLEGAKASLGDGLCDHLTDKGISFEPENRAIPLAAAFTTEKLKAPFLGVFSEPDAMVGYRANFKTETKCFYGIPVFLSNIIAIKYTSFNLGACHEALVNPTAHKEKLEYYKAINEDPLLHGVATDKQVEQLKKLLTIYTTFSFHAGLCRYIITDYKSFLFVRITQRRPRLPRRPKRGY